MTTADDRSAQELRDRALARRVVDAGATAARLDLAEGATPEQAKATLAEQLRIKGIASATIHRSPLIALNGMANIAAEAVVRLAETEGSAQT